MITLLENWEVLAGILLCLHAAASGIVALTPTPKDDIWLGKVYKAVEVVALAIGKAKQQPGEAPKYASKKDAA